MGRCDTLASASPARGILGLGFFGGAGSWRFRSRWCWRLGRRSRRRRRRSRLFYNLLLRGHLLGSGLFGRGFLRSSLLGCLLHGLSSFLCGLLLGCHSRLPRTFLCSAVRVI